MSEMVTSGYLSGGGRFDLGPVLRLGAHAASVQNPAKTHNYLYAQVLVICFLA